VEICCRSLGGPRRGAFRPLRRPSAFPPLPLPCLVVSCCPVGRGAGSRSARHCPALPCLSRRVASRRVRGAVGLGHPGRARGSLGRRERLAKLATGYTLARATPVVQCPWGRRTGRRRQRASGAARGAQRRQRHRGPARGAADDGRHVARLPLVPSSTTGWDGRPARCGVPVRPFPFTAVGAHTETYVLPSRHASPHAGATGRAAAAGEQPPR
jgi:hypothetical protein